MAIKSILSSQIDFTGEVTVTSKTAALWRMNESASSSSGAPEMVDASGNYRSMTITNWSGTTAGFPNGRYGRCFRFNTTNPATEKTYLTCANNTDIFGNIGSKVVIGGWINPTTYTLGTTHVPIVSTRNGTGNPIFYIAFNAGKLRIILYNSAGASIIDQNETLSTITMANGGWYFIAYIIDVTNKTEQLIVCNRADSNIEVSPLRSFTGTINTTCTADIVFGMLSNSYWYSGGFDDWFLETDSNLTVDIIKQYFLNAQIADGGDMAGAVDAISIAGSVTLRSDSSGVYPTSGQLVTTAATCNLSGSGRVSVAYDYTPGTTSISSIETSTSNNLITWSEWIAVGTSGEVNSPNGTYIRYRITLATSDTSQTPQLHEITLYDITKSPYSKLGFSHPVTLDANGAWESILENVYDVIVTKEVNGVDQLEFKIPYDDKKRPYIISEKQVQVVDDVYRVRTISDEKDTNGILVSHVYCEALFYDLSYSSEEKYPTEFNAAFPDRVMYYALQGSGWGIGTVNITTRRTWRCEEKNPLAILRKVQDIYGGDLVFDNKNNLVSLVSYSGKDSGALFSYRKNLTGIKRITDTRSLITRLYAVGKDGITFEKINNGKAYVEDFTYTNEVRVNSLDLSSFTNMYQMLEYTQMRLAQYSKPRISYVANAMDMSALTQYQYENWALGDIVTVDDQDLDITIQARIVRMQYNLQEPWNNVIELSTTLRELGSAVNDTMADQLSQISSLRQDINDMVPFNHLMNSRADDGFDYWVNSGFTIDPSNGMTGAASFKASGNGSAALSMYQTVQPANRRSYTISAEIASENLQKGNDGQVGFELTFTYADGTTETRFIDLIS
jgi:phage minor structural protein